MSTTGKFRARDGWLALVATFGFILLSLSVFTRQISRRDKLAYQVSRPKLPPAVIRTPPPPGASPPSRSYFPHLHIPWWLVAGIGQAALVAVVLLVVLFLARVVPRLGHAKPVPKLPEPPTPAPELDEQAAEQVVDIFDSARLRLRRGHTRDAIIACWLRLEELADQACTPKRASETSTELVARWSATLSLSIAPLTELAALYREARFSSHDMSAGDSERARQALELLRRDVTGQRVPADG
ncbi:MAG: DUF4129 domain-containing protein [Actinomycetota bacterium]|nr:DUF4129 domain-containing protein [Actinomycetota bacterium]